MTQRQQLVVVHPDGGRTIPIGNTSARLLNTGDDTAEASSTEELHVPAHFDGPPAHFHNKTNHSWYVTQGELRLTVDGTSYDLSPGGFVYVPVGRSHTFANVTSHAATMVRFNTPGGFDRYLSDLADSIPVGTDPDPATILEVMARHDTFPQGRSSE